MKADERGKTSFSLLHVFYKDFKTKVMPSS